MLFNRTASSTVLLVFFALCAGCVVGPEYTLPETTVPTDFATEENSFYSAAATEVEWWRGLQDDTLNQLIEQAVAHNHDLRLAETNVNAARALLGEGRYEQYPIVTSGGSISHEEASAARSQGAGSNFDRTNTFYNAALDASWELDFFGRVKRSIEALAADYDAIVAEQRNVHVIVTAEVARTYLELRGAQYRLKVAEENATNQRGTYDLTRSITEGGLGTNLDIVRSQAQLESTLASIPLLETEIMRTVHRLSVLVGEEPRALRSLLSTFKSLPDVPELLNIGAPADLLRRRPDILNAERRLAAATARIGVATADLFPRVSLIGSVGYTTTSLSDLGEDQYRGASFGPSLFWPAFDLGRVRARIRAADATAEGTLVSYEKTVLAALEETENVLVRFTKARERQSHLQIAAESTEEAIELARVRYSNGIDSFLNVLDAERQLLELQDQLAQSETETGLALVALYKALGGGWESSVSPASSGAK
ncbi:MAG: multidrug efflux outer membrane protein OprN [marine bacterium B5-7]|nr:MAG: multidrug efflux outer membrane protein OprN [marine bacterium B5-7]